MTKRMSKQTQEVSEGQLVQLDPKLIEASPKNNARFGLIPTRLAKMKQEILDMGGVMLPVEVAPLPSPVNGFQYRLTSGNYRLAAVLELNKEGAGLSLPSIIRETKEGMESTVRNITENIGRQDMTPMDQAHAAKLLLAGGMEKIKVREMFARPGRPGPASNSWLNTTLSFLEFPKAIQTKLHLGELSWDAGRDLMRVKKDHPDKFDDTLAELEADRQKAIDRETKEEEKLLNVAKKAEDAITREKEADQKAKDKEVEKAAKLQVARDAVAKADIDNAALITAAQEELKAATAKVTEDPAAHTEVAAAVKKLESVQKEAVRTKDRAVTALAKMEARMAEENKKAQDELKAERAKATEAKMEAAAARQASKPGGSKAKGTAEKAATGSDVRKAAAKVGAGTGEKALNRTDIMALVNTNALPGGSGKAEVTVRKIFVLLRDCFGGRMTENQLYKRMLEVCK